MKGGIGKRVKAAACVLAVLFLVLSAAVEVKASFFFGKCGTRSDEGPATRDSITGWTAK